MHHEYLYWALVIHGISVWSKNEDSFGVWRGIECLCIRLHGVWKAVVMFTGITTPATLMRVLPSCHLILWARWGLVLGLRDFCLLESLHFYNQFSLKQLFGFPCACFTGLLVLIFTCPSSLPIRVQRVCLCCVSIHVVSCTCVLSSWPVTE